MKVKTNYTSDWSDNGAFIECLTCGAVYVDECTCCEVVEIEKCPHCGNDDFEINEFGVCCSYCTATIGQPIEE